MPTCISNSKLCQGQSRTSLDGSQHGEKTDGDWGRDRRGWGEAQDKPSPGRQSQRQLQQRTGELNEFGDGGRLKMSRELD